MVAFVTILFACFLLCNASHARAVPPAAAGLAELQAALGEGGLEDAQEVGLTLRRLGLTTVLEVGLLDAAERLELTEHLKTANIQKHISSSGVCQVHSTQLSLKAKT
jgi:hypothetical protein